MSVIFYVIKFCSKFIPEFYGLDNVDLQNNYAIELNAIGRFRSRLKNSQHENNTRR